MPRSARIDIPGLLHHVIVRGIERSDIFLDDDDRRSFLGGQLASGFAFGDLCDLQKNSPGYATGTPYLIIGDSMGPRIT